MICVNANTKIKWLIKFIFPGLFLLRSPSVLLQDRQQFFQEQREFSRYKTKPRDSRLAWNPLKWLGAFPCYLTGFSSSLLWALWKQLLAISGEAPLWGQRWPTPLAEPEAGGQPRPTPRASHGGGETPSERITASTSSQVIVYLPRGVCQGALIYCKRSWHRIQNTQQCVKTILRVSLRQGCCLLAVRGNSDEKLSCALHAEISPYSGTAEG